MSLLSELQRAMSPMKRKIQLMVGRAVLESIKDDGGIQVTKLSGLAGEALDGVPRVQEFGFSSNPPPGTDAIMIAVGGDRDSLVVIATDHKTFRFKSLASGESVLYTDDGTHIHLKKGGQIDVTTATKVTITAPDVEITGNLKVGGTTHGVGAATYDATLAVAGNTTIGGTLGVTGKVTGAADIESAATIKAATAVQAPLVQAGGYAGPAGGAPGVVTTQNITTTGNIQANNVTATGNVTGGGTNLSAVKSTFNAHTHTETGTTTNPPGATL